VHKVSSNVLLVLKGKGKMHVFFKGIDAGKLYMLGEVEK
jgi:hypothetical protein